MQTTCGVIVSDGRRFLLGHATRSPRWDIPKGVCEPHESYLEAALRELAEETGLEARPDALVALGTFDYLAGKRIALFSWPCDPLPDTARLVCRSMVSIAGRPMPELDRFGLFTWTEGISLVGRNLARVLDPIGLPHSR